MDDLIHALELLRERHHFGGYIHVKIVPGAEAAQVERINALASRVSLNFEAACGESLSRLAPDKSFARSLATLDQARQLVVLEREAEEYGRPRGRLHPGGTSGRTMQFVVGATPDTYRTLIGRMMER
jgi:predicted DNA-binding helix-hairpin-helix protein